jgi:hypothetical protein
MRNNRKLRTNVHAIAMIYDTLLFLSLISLAGVVLLPAFIPENQVSTSQHLHHDKFVQETLQTFLITHIDQLNYTLAGEHINFFATSLGINTTHSAGLYQSITQWILGKQQLHKTFGEHIGEVLFFKLGFPISNNESICFDFLTMDYEKQLMKRMKEMLDDQIPPPFHYNLHAYWKPVKYMDFRGFFEIGKPVSEQQHSYTAAQTIHIPFLPIFIVDDSLIILTKQWFQNTILKDIESSTILCNFNTNAELLKSLNETDEQFDYLITCQQENLTQLSLSLICDGLVDENNTILIPGIFSTLVNTYISNLFPNDEKPLYIAGNETLGYGIDRFDTFISDCTKLDEQQFLSYFTSSIKESFLEYLINSSINEDEILTTIIDSILSTIRHHLTPFINSLIRDSLSTDILMVDVNVILDELLDLIFSQLTLTQATVTLTIWDGRLP